MTPQDLTAQQIVDMYHKKDFYIYDDGSLNIGAIRCTDSITDQWDDVKFDIWFDEDGEWQLNILPATTKPGLCTLAEEGERFLVAEGHYPDCYTYSPTGHFGHRALIQIGEIKGYRIKDANYDLSQLELTTTDASNGVNYQGVWNKDDPNWDGTYPNVGVWSQACLVAAKPSDHNSQMDRCVESNKLGANSFSLTLFNISDFSENS